MTRLLQTLDNLLLFYCQRQERVLEHTAHTGPRQSCHPVKPLFPCWKNTGQGLHDAGHMYLSIPSRALEDIVNQSGNMFLCIQDVA